MSDPQSTMSQTTDPCGTLPEQLEGFLTRLAAEGKSPLTIACYRRDLARLGAFAGDVPAAGITADLLARFLVSDLAVRAPDGRVRGESSLGRTKACLRSFGRFLADVGATGRNPAAWVRVQRHARPAPAFLAPAEVGRLVKAVSSRKGEAAERDRTILMVLLGTGIRLSELVGLDIADVRLDEKKLVLRRVKGGGSQTRFLNTRLRAELRGYLRRRRKVLADTDALFLSSRGRRISNRQVQERMRLWLAWAGLAGKITVHGLRHTFATMLYARTRNLLLVSKALGHAQVATTQVYAHIAEDDLEEALEAL